MFGCFRLRLKSSKLSAAAVRHGEPTGIASGEGNRQEDCPAGPAFCHLKPSVATVCTVVKHLASASGFSTTRSVTRSSSQ